MLKNQSRFEWLSDYLDLEQSIQVMEWRIAKSEREERRWTEGDLRHIHLVKKSKGSHVMDNVPKEREQVAEWKAEQAEIIRLIETFRDPMQEMLKLKYIDHMTLEQAAETMGYSYETLRSMHAEAHRALDFLDDFIEQQREFENRQDYIKPEDR